MARSLSGSASPSSSEEALPSSKSRRRGSRTLVACEACKKRKTKCSGRPSRCDACYKLDTFCHFNSKLDARRKTAYKPIALHEKKEYIFSGILKSIKFNDSKDVNRLIETIRSNASPQQIAACLKQNLQLLQEKSLVAALDVDENDIVSLGLQGLFSHRGKRATFISKDQTSYPAVTHKSDGTNHPEDNVRDLHKNNYDGDSRLGDRDCHASPENMEETSPMTTETSISLCLDDNSTSFAMIATDSRNRFSGAARKQSISNPSTKKNDRKRKSFKAESIPNEVGGEHREYPPGSNPSAKYHTGPAAATMHSYPQDREHDQISPTDRFYMHFNPSIGASPGEQLAVEHMHHFKPMNQPTLSTGNMPQLDWSPPHRNREAGNSFFTPQPFTHDIGSNVMGEDHHLDFHDSIFVDNMFHPDHSIQNQQINTSYP